MSVAVCEARMAAMSSRISSFLKSFDNGIIRVLERSHHQTIARWEDSMKAIEASNLRKTYPGGLRALDGLGFAVEAGTIFGLLGPNGAGKSTTVKILTTLSRADSGEARVAGLDVVREAERVRRAIGVVGQRPGLDPDATGRENLEMRGDTVQVELAESNGYAAAVIKRLRGVRELTTEGRVLRARVDDGAAVIPSLITALEQRGLRVASATVARPSLDDVYLRHAGRSFQVADTETKEVAA